MSRVARKARNQALFREVNERIAEVAADFDAVAPEKQDFVCECSQIGCTQLVQLPMAAYAQIRSDAAEFVVLSGHEDPDHETVVERHDGYVIARNKPGVAEEIALEATQREPFSPHTLQP